MTIEDWSAEAFNQVPDSQNEIHGDRVSKLYGFEGGLVPGVTVSAYLLHPGVVAWGRDFLDRGRSHVRVISPLYDGERFEVSVADVSADSYRAELRRPGDVLCATAEVSLPDAPPPAPRRRGDPVEEETWQGPAATRAHWAELQANGCRALRFRWDQAHRMARYLRVEAEGMPALLTGEAPFANTAYVLGVSNWVLAANGYMNPWVHLETTAQHFRAIAAGTTLVAEMAVADFFERKGHQFVDVTVTLFEEAEAEADNAALASIDLRAIYRLRGI